MNKTRRIDIDFLRAISVLSVILFHLDKNIFPLGYLGVDIFFIISGYLISKIIINENSKKSFNFYNFYLRRIRRIVPAFLIVLILTISISSFLLLLPDLKSLSKSLISSLGFFPNIYFWLTGGYFGTNDELKPLLHLWSLGIEEQFYLFFPFFFLLILRQNLLKNFKIIIVLFIILASYSLNFFLIKKGHYDPNFFLLPFRIWQFGTGALIALIPKVKIINQFNKFLLVCFAFFLIILNFYKVNPNIPHATYLTIGCSLLIYIGINKNDFMYKFINIKFFIFTGLISYSLYLWHWPIISIFKYLKITELNQIDLITCFLSTYVLAIFSWKYIEQPFLQSKNIYTLIKFVGLSYLFLIFLCILILFNKNFPSPYEKFPNSIAEANGSTYHCNLFEYRKFGDTYACELNTKKNNLEFVLFGNSHAHMYGWPIKKLLKEYDKNGLTIPLNNCLPTINKNISLSCLIKANNYFNSISANKEIKTVIIGLTWHTLNLIDKNGQKFNKVEDRNDSLLHLVNQFKLLDKKVFLIGPIEKPGYDIPSLISREIALKKFTEKVLSVNRSSFDEKYKDTIIFFKNELSENFIEPHKVLCDLNDCYFVEKNGSNYSDSNHLSYFGAMKMKNILSTIFQK